MSCSASCAVAWTHLSLSTSPGGFTRVRLPAKKCVGLGAGGAARNQGCCTARDDSSSPLFQMDTS